MMPPNNQKLVNLYAQLLKEFPNPKDAFVALEYLTATTIISAVEDPKNKKTVEAIVYRFYRNLKTRTEEVRSSIE